MFAIDGVKLPSHASKRRSGTRAEFTRQAAKLEKAAAAMVARHRATDNAASEPTLSQKDQRRVEQRQRDAAELRAWLAANLEDRRGPKGTLRKSNRTDNASAKMATGKGVIQGYTGVAAVDAAAQIIVEAQAYGTGAEQECLLPVVTAIAPFRTATSLITADAGYHSEQNLRALAEDQVDALIADGGLRQRDTRFATQAAQHAEAHPYQTPVEASSRFRPEDFTYDPVARTCLRAQCLRTPERTAVRQVAFFHGTTAERRNSFTAQMQQRIDHPDGRARDARRFAVVEPVFANLRHNKRLDRLTLRGQAKVDGQWQLFCLVHNIEKLAHHGYAAYTA